MSENDKIMLFQRRHPAFQIYLLALLNINKSHGGGLLLMFTI